MQIDIITIFPEMFKGVFDFSIIKRARQKKIVEINLYNLRDYTTDKHKKVDAPPYGGGSGMVMMPDPIFRAAERILRKNIARTKQRIVLLSPQGRVLSQKIVKEYLDFEQIILICGRYEGVDNRVRQALIDDEISIGDYVLGGGEIPAMVFVDCLVRLLPGALGDEASKKIESFEEGLLEYPQYTRPQNYRGMKVPQILLSGNHRKIQEWRKKKALETTLKKRPDLLKKEAEKWIS